MQRLAYSVEEGTKHPADRKRLGIDGQCLEDVKAQLAGIAQLFERVEQQKGRFGDQRDVVRVVFRNIVAGGRGTQGRLEQKSEPGFLSGREVGDKGRAAQAFDRCGRVTALALERDLHALPAVADMVERTAEGSPVLVDDNAPVDATNQFHTGRIVVSAGARQLHRAGVGFEGHGADVVQEQQCDRVEIPKAGGYLAVGQSRLHVVAIEGEIEYSAAAC